ncbi:MFS transporter [Caballeronia sordidicola]|uniref:MFS transporter n=1 Tax=Caballeronia sordidicola TaxID=196367 RepID=A0A158HP87_CABSO|nr:MFS transporter [Caballeronia sordidicola]SAL46224.1 MFS transporter [Caballeronia sordidicola]
MFQPGTAASGKPESTSLKRVVFASFAGSTIEWYDFTVFSASSALVFNRLFFTSFSPTVGLLLALLTYAIGYLARPLGGVIFGHFGDRLGRKPVLIITFMMMGGATIIMGLLPTFEQVGVAAPIVLTILRITQGIALGGEYGGAALLVSETCPADKRGLYSSSTLVGLAAGTMLGTIVFGLFRTMPQDEFFSWGWRMPFLLSIVLVVIGLWIRMRIDETPEFLKVEKSHKVSKLPIAEVLKHDLKRVLLVCAARSGETMQFNIVAVFGLRYVTHNLGVPPSVYLSAMSLSSFLSIFIMPLSGALSDRIGRKPVGLLAGIASLVFGAAYLPLVTTGSTLLISLAVILMLAISAGIGNALPSAYFPELFKPEVRYTAVSLGYQLGTVAGGLTPAISTLLYLHFGIDAIAAYLAVAGLLVIMAFFLLPETLPRGSRSGF